MFLNSKRGFTLIEILVVILIIAISSALVSPVAYKSVDKFNNLIKKAKQKETKDYVAFLSFISDSGCLDNGSFIVCGSMKYNVK